MDKKVTEHSTETEKERVPTLTLSAIRFHLGPAHALYQQMLHMNAARDPRLDPVLHVQECWAPAIFRQNKNKDRCGNLQPVTHGGCPFL